MKINLRQKTILIIFGLFLTFTILETGMRLGGFIILFLQERRNLLSIRQKGEYRIICFGESTTRSTYPPYLEKILNQRNMGIKFSVIDKGIPGTNTGFIVSRLEADLDKYQPDLVITMMGINDRGFNIPYQTGLSTQITLFFKPFRTYKLVRLLWLHIITKAKETGFYNPQQNNRFERNVQEIGTRAAYTDSKEGNLIQRQITFKKAIELNPQNDGAYVGLGWLYLREGKPNEAEKIFKKALELNPGNERTYARLAVVYRELGNNTLYKDYQGKAKRLREMVYDVMTINNYLRFKQILNRKRVKWICVQYPMLSIEPLKKMLEGGEGISFVDNERIFKDAVARHGYRNYFSDIFAGEFGHCTEEGNRLLAENIVNGILKELFSK